MLARDMIKETDVRNPDVHQQYLEMVKRDAITYFSDPGRLQQVTCPGCRSAEFDREFEKFGFSYVSCKRCFSLYVNPRPQPFYLEQFYVESPSTRFWIEDFFKPKAEARRQKIFQPRAELVAKVFPALRSECIGDIGAGFGLFLEELQKFWPEANLVAIEPSPEMASICSSKGFEVEKAMVEDLKGRDISFGLLTAFELLEHLYEPRVLIEIAYRLLKPGGYFLATTLNGRGFDIQLLWDKSKTVFPPHHLNFLNPASLAKLCEDVGFVVENSETPGVLDWDIVDGMIQRQEVHLDRFWHLLSTLGGDECKRELQSWISRHNFSSHMRIIVRKPK